MTTYPCPVCGAPADLTAGCGGCGRAPDPRAAEVVRLNAELAALAPRVQEALDAYTALAGEFRALRERRDGLAIGVRQSRVDVRAGTAAPAAVLSPAPAAVSATAPTPVHAPAPAVRPETRPVTVQNLLFVLGGLLVGAAAVVFTGVAWATYGAVGRSVALGVVTLLALAVPPLAARRGLRGTGETFAAIAMLLVVLDGYGAWYVDLFGLGGVPGAGYAAGVCAVTAAVGVGYGLATCLAAPRFAALAAIQPVAPLLAAEWEAGVRGWSLAFTVTAVASLAVARLAGRELRVVAWALYGCGQVLSGVSALVALLQPGPVAVPALVGGAALLSAAALVAAGRLARSAPLRTVAAAVAVLALGGAVVRPLAQLAPSVLLVAAAATVLGLALAAHLARRPLTYPDALGARIGAVVAVALLAPVAAGMAAANALGTVAASLPAWEGGSGTGPPFDWQVPAAVALATAALALAAPAGWRRGIAVAGAAVALLALPVPWWALVPLELAAAAVLALGLLPARPASPAATPEAALAARPDVAPAGRPDVVPAARPDVAPAARPDVAPVGRPDVAPAARAAARRTDWRVAAVAGPVAAVLAGHAILVSLIRPWSATAALGTLVAIGVAALALAERTGARVPSLGNPTGVIPPAFGDRAGVIPPAPGARGRANGVDIVRRVAFGVGLVAWPAAAACGVFAGGAAEPWPARAGLVAATLLLLPVAVLGGRAARPYAVAALAVAVTGAALWPDLAGAGDPTGLYPALGLLVLATAYRAVRPADGGSRAGGRGAGRGPTNGRESLVAAAVPHGLVLLAVLVPLSYVLFLEPFRWLGDIWNGAPADADPGLPSGGPAAVLLLAAALALVGWRAAAVLAGLVGVVAVVAAAEAPWPVVPGASLALGTAVVLAFTLRRGGRSYGVPIGCLMAAPGLAGLLPTEAATLSGLGFVVVAAAVVGAAGATEAVRTGGWLAAVTAGGAFAIAATLAGGQPLARGAYPLLGVAALALGLVVLPRLRGRRMERVALDAAAHASAAVALVLTIGEARHAAAVCTLWAAAVAARAVAPGETARRALALVSGGSVLLAWWLLLTAESVALTEAYTLPAAAFALVAGHVALRARPAIGSWVGYAPGLAVALLPSLASILVADGQGVRRLLLGLGALLAVLAGAYEKRQAPLVVGGGTLVAVALHEVLVWDLLPRWAYLAVGGLVLIAVAMTYERRLRDLRRLRGAIARMT
ncbi:SCO7613 C-terminal domain-containing membrane protein [Phytohabitans sp. LJ34]|uniref:SCO7613 C-terminal domain-containing membrane protein n=1 Tax=Phytohabitans sp. LJ34 TaxID=3452217 RepID=UPI003F89CDFA